MDKGREYIPSSAIFTNEKLSADLTLVLFNDTIYLYIDGELCTGNFSNCYTMPVSITNANLKENGTYTAGTKFRFGLATARCWEYIVGFSNVSLKTGDEALSEITANYSHTITWLDDDDTVLKETKVFDGQIPTYDGTPTKASTAQYKYTFTGWSPEVVSATQDATYKATYSQASSEYTITWKNADGTILETDENVKYGETPTYDGDTPADCASGTTKYKTFTSWTPSIEDVTGDATYTAVFETEEVFAKNIAKDGEG